MKHAPFTLEARLGRKRVKRGFPTLEAAREASAAMVRNHREWGPKDFATVTANPAPAKP